MTVVRAALVVATVSALVGGTLSVATHAVALAAASRITVPGTAAVGQARAERLAAVAPDRTMSFAVTLPLRNEAALQRLIADVSDPRSPDYGHYLTSRQFATRFGPTTASVERVSAYLRSSGLDVTAVSANRTVIDVQGTASRVGSALATTIGVYRDPRLHRTYTANDSPVRLPSDIAHRVLGVVGLDHHYPLLHAPLAPHAEPRVGGGPSGGYTPAQLKGAYDVAPLASAGDNGTGQHVGIFELAAFRQRNITSYDSHYGLGSPAPAVVGVDGGSSVFGDAQVEVELDIEVVQAIAPKASITVWEAPNTDQGVVDTYNAMATSDTTPVNSTSWGQCERVARPAVVAAEHNAFQQMAAQGQAIFAASGDSAAYDCGKSGQLAVDNPADDPYVTGTGGTRLAVSGQTYTSETPWDTNALEGGGGGVSTVYAKPSWQTGTPAACTKRCVPDVAADADPATGYSVYTQGAWTVVGGTSAAAPLWAGVASVYDQAALAAGKPRLGYANPTLYQLASGGQSLPAIHDVTTGHTSTSSFWPARRGYDMATGIGSVDANNLAGDLLGSGTTPGDFSISASPAAVSVAAGYATGTTISTATTSGGPQPVSLAASGLPTGVSAAFTPTTVASGASATLKIATSTTTPTGTYAVTVTGTSGSAAHTTTVSLSVGSATRNLVGNAGFETGTAPPWTLSAGVLNDTSAEPPHRGSWDAWLDGVGSTHTDRATQSITIPAGHTSAAVSFYLHIDTAEGTTSTAYDRLVVQLGTITVHRFSNLNANNGYALRSYTVSGLAPGTYALKFTGTEDSSLQTSFVVDDVTVKGV